jgi:hypothetical protein
MLLLDFSEAYTTATSGSNATVTVPTIPNNPLANTGMTPSATTNSQHSYWVIVVEGADVYVNLNAVATSANAALPVGFSDGRAFRLQPGAVINVLAVSGSGTFSIIRCRE